MTLTIICLFIKYYLLVSFYRYSDIVWWYSIIILWEKKLWYNFIKIVETKRELFYQNFTEIVRARWMSLTSWLFWTNFTFKVILRSWRTLTLMTSWPWKIVYFDWLSMDYLVFWLQLHSLWPWWPHDLETKYILIGSPRTTFYSDYSFIAQLAIVQINNIEKKLPMTLTFIYLFFIKYYLLVTFYIYSAIVWWYPIIILW